MSRFRPFRSPTRAARPWVAAALAAGLLGAASASGVAAQTAPAPDAAAPTSPAAPAPVATPAGTGAGTQTAPARTSAAPSPAGDPEPAAASPGALPHDLSPWAMFQHADVVVKAVMVGLAFASLVTWTVWLAKGLQLAGARFRAVRGLRAVLEAGSLADLAGDRGSGPVTALVHAAASERERSGGLAVEGVKERAAIALGRVEARAARGMSRGTGVVATIGSTAPFVGLFGTVWGIMNSFVGISHAHTTNLAVVAPGIAEALLATAVGLVAAIPAVVIYNLFARSIAAYRAILADASAEVMRHLSRDLDRGAPAAAE